MYLKEIWIYPVKGLQGITVTSAQLTDRGLEHDRRYMLIDAQHRFLSQRSHPELALMTTGIDMSTGDLSVYTTEESVTIKPSDRTSEVIQAEMWDKHFDVHVLSASVNEWWSRQLGITVKMVCQADDDLRVKEYVGDGDRTEVSLADGYPYLMVGTASLTKLNSKLDTPIKMDRFRGNLILESEEPHIEDTLGHCQIGTESFYVVKPCARCQVITIDQQTGQRGKEPLATLATYRRDGQKVNFGANAVANSLGTIKVGDKVTKL